VNSRFLFRLFIPRKCSEKIATVDGYSKFNALSRRTDLRAKPKSTRSPTNISCWKRLHRHKNEWLASSKTKPSRHALDFTYVRQTGSKVRVPEKGPPPRIRPCNQLTEPKHLLVTMRPLPPLRQCMGMLAFFCAKRPRCSSGEKHSTFQRTPKKNPKRRLLPPASRARVADAGAHAKKCLAVRPPAQPA